MFEIEYEFREDDLIHFNEVLFMRSEEIQNNIKKNRYIVPGIFALVGFFYYVYYGDQWTAAYVMAIALIWMLISPKVMLMDLRRQVLAGYTNKEKVDMFGKYTLTIDPEDPKYLIEKSPSGKNKMTWDELVRVEYGKGYVYIFITLDTALVIPVAAVSKGDLEKFAEQAEKMIERSE